MGAQDVWVELGPGLLVRADSVNKVEAQGPDILEVKVSGEREPRVLRLRVQGQAPRDWSEDRVERFQDSCHSQVVARGLIDAIADAKADKGGWEIGLRIDYGVAGWHPRRLGAHSLDALPGDSFWDGIPYDDTDDEDSEPDLGNVEPCPIWNPREGGL